MPQIVARRTRRRRSAALIAIKAVLSGRRDPSTAASPAAKTGNDMTLLSLPWWSLPKALFLLSVAALLAVNRWCLHRHGANQHLVLGLFVSACLAGAIIVILQRVQ